MKRFLFCLALSMIFITPMYSQIQNRFFGYMFGSRMYHMVDAMGDNLYLKEDDNLSVKDVKFGGLSWDYAEMQYFNDQFSSISFSLVNKSEKVASDYFRLLKDKLDDKYNLYKFSQSCTSRRVVYTDFENVCMLEYKYCQSKGGEMYWYLDLSYWNLELSKKVIDTHNSEL